MLIKVMKVEDLLDLSGRSIAVIPSITPQLYEEIRKENRCELRRPDGSALDGIEFKLMTLLSADPVRPWSLVLPGTFPKEAIPVGTEVWVESRKEKEESRAIVQSWFLAWCSAILIGTFNPLYGGAIITAVCAKIALLDSLVALVFVAIARRDRLAWACLVVSLAAASIWILPYSRQVGP